MKQQGEFLTAEWNNLLMPNYVVHPSLLEPFVPSGTELDEFQGRIHVSLVGFEKGDSLFAFAMRELAGPQPEGHR